MTMALEHRPLLWSTLEARRARNPHYSLRAFAKQLGVSPALLSQLLKGKVPLSKKTANKIALHLDLSEDEKTRLLNQATSISTNAKAQEEWRQLKADEFSIVSDWYHYGILGLAGLKENKAEASWISERLHISVKEAQQAFDRLRKMKLIEVRKGRFIQTGIPLTTTTDVPSFALRKHHRQNLHRAEHTLDHVSVDQRYFSSATIAMDSTDYQFVTREIEKFRRKVTTRLKQPKGKDRVYTLGIQFFPCDIGYQTNNKEKKK